MKKTMIMMVACLLCVAGVSAATLNVNPASLYVGETVTFYGNAGVGGGYLFLTGPNLYPENTPDGSSREGNVSVSGEFTYSTPSEILSVGTFTVGLHTKNQNNETETITQQFEIKTPYLTISPPQNTVMGEPVYIEMVAGGSKDLRVAVYHSYSGQLVDTGMIGCQNDKPTSYKFTPTMSGIHEVIVWHPGTKGNYGESKVPSTRGDYLSETEPVKLSKTDPSKVSSERVYRGESVYSGFSLQTSFTVIAPAPTVEPTPALEPTIEPTQEPVVEKTDDLKEPEPTTESIQELEIQASPDTRSEEILIELEEIKREQALIREAQEEQKGLLDAILDFLYGIFGIRR